MRCDAALGRHHRVPVDGGASQEEMSEQPVEGPLVPDGEGEGRGHAATRLVRRSTGNGTKLEEKESGVFNERIQSKEERDRRALVTHDSGETENLSNHLERYFYFVILRENGTAFQFSPCS